MRVLLVNKYWRMAGGVEVHAFAVKRWLESRGHEVIPFAMSEESTLATPYSEFFPSEVDMRANGARGALQGISRATISSDTKDRLDRLIAATKPDAAYVLHVYHQLGMRVLNILAQNNIPTILSLHDYKIACPNYRFFSERTGKICTKCLDSGPGYALFPIVERCWSNSAAAGAALAAEAVATRLRRSYRKPGVVTVLNSLQRRAAISAGVEPARVMTVPHPVRLLPPRSGAVPGNFLYIGRLVPEKGVEILIRAAAQANERVTIVGGGRSEDDLKALADEVNAPVDFLDEVPHAEVAKLMREARALIVPSVWHEVSPLVVYEAIELDLPVIASRVGGMIDQLADDRGVLVEPGDVGSLAAAMSAASDDKDLDLRRRSGRARAYARDHWSDAHWGRNLEEAFNRAGASV